MKFQIIFTVKFERICGGSLG